MIRTTSHLPRLLALVVLLVGQAVFGADPPAEQSALPGRRDWPKWGGSPLRKNVSDAKNIPIHWRVGQWDRAAGTWDLTHARNIKWVANIDTGTWSPGMAAGPALLGDKLYIGSSTGYGAKVDLARLVCFQARNGKTVWEFLSPRRGPGEAWDWPMNCICSTPFVEGNRLMETGGLSDSNGLSSKPRRGRKPPLFASGRG